MSAFVALAALAVAGWTAALVLLAVAGWTAALVLVLSFRRRLALVADAEHELRGAAAAIGLAAERISRTGSGAAFMSLVALQLDRIGAALADLAAARSRRGAEARDPDLDAGRLAQVLGNLIANAAEHGTGAVDVRTSRRAGAVRIEIRNRNRPRELADAGSEAASGAAPPARLSPAPGRGRGVAIAARAARELGGRLSVEASEATTEVALELPAEPDADAADQAA
ncbi:MAG: ATP-binding protein [Thermoleophilaceae bacterium]